MKIIDGHSHMLQTFMPLNKLKSKVSEIEHFNMNHLLERLDDLGVSHLQTMAQDMTRIRNSWLGSNALSADIRMGAPDRIISFAGAEPLDRRGHLNTKQLKEIEILVLLCQDLSKDGYQ